MGDSIDHKNLRVTGQHKAIAQPHVDVLDGLGENDVVVVVTQAYGPTGANLVGISDVTFDGHPAVTIGIKAGDQQGLVHLSPIHGDSRKQGLTDIPAGTVCELSCPVSGHPLDQVGDVEDGMGASYYALYLTPQLSRGDMVMISNVWGHYHSRIVDNFELISAWAATHDDA
jgi:hypothetical protein